MNFPKSFFDKMQEIAKYGTDAGFYNSDVNLEFSTCRRTKVTFSAYTHKDLASNSFVYEAQYFDASDDNMIWLERLYGKVRALDTPDKIRRAQFQKKLGKLIDEAKEIDIDVEFINPLTALAKKLSENAIEHHPEPAE